MRLNSAEKMRCRMCGVDTPPFPTPIFPPVPPPLEAAPSFFFERAMDACVRCAAAASRAKGKPSISAGRVW